MFENGNQDTSLLDAVSRSLEEPKEKSSEELMRKQISKKHAGGVSLLVVFLVWFVWHLYIFK